MNDDTAQSSDSPTPGLAAAAPAPPAPSAPFGPIPPPAPPFLWASRRGDVPLGRSTVAVLATVVASAVLWDLALQTRAAGAAACAAVLVSCIGLASAGWVVRTGGRRLLAIASALSVCLVLRVSPWMILLDLVTIAALMALACSAERAGRWGDTRFATLGRRMAATVSSVASAPAPLTRATVATLSRSGDRQSSAGALIRGALVAIPIMVVVGINLASADAVFASLFHLDLHLDRWLGHVAVVALAVWFVAGWFVQAGRPPVSHPPRTVSLGGVEATVVMVGLTSLYAVFAWTQVLVARRGPEYVVATTGLTYAQYARSGFFQLLWVGAATALGLLVMRSVVVPRSDRAARCLAVSGAAVSALTLVVVRAAMIRLDLYEAAFGLTLLRFAASATAWWLAAVFLVIGAWFALAWRSSRDWLPTALGITTLVVVIGLNLVNPEATVARHNLDRAATGADLDVDYTKRLSDDAVPTLVAGVDSLSSEPAAALRGVLCAKDDPGPQRWNTAERSAAAALDRLNCP